MSRRPQKPLPPALFKMKYDPSNNRYFFTEKHITYFLTLEHTRLLKEFIRGDSSATVAAWYESLDRQTKKNIFREGIETMVEVYYDGNHFE